MSCYAQGSIGGRWGGAMIEMRRAQLSFGDGLIAGEVSDLREEWMQHADQVLADEQIVAAVYEALAQRRPKSRNRGRLGTPAEMVLRLLVLKHIRNLSYAALEREVRANLVYRNFSRVGGGKMLDAKTMGRWGLAVGPQVLRQIHDRMVKIAQDNGVVAGRRMRVDTTVVETNTHYPTDSTLLGDGVRVLTRTMRKITDIVGAVGTKLRDRSRSVKLRLFEIARIARAKGPLNRERLQQRYRRLLDTTRRVVGQAKRFSKEISEGVKKSTDILQQIALERLRDELDRMLPLVRRVMHQTRARIFHGDTHVEDKVLSLFEPSTEIIRRGKAGKPNEFGKMIKLQEAENQIIVMRSMLGDPMIPISWSRPLQPIRPSWGACRDWWRLTLASTLPGTRPLRRRGGSSVCASPIARAGASSANASRRSAGSAMARNGGRDVKDASA
jgi:transposase, IS5 family